MTATAAAALNAPRFPLGAGIGLILWILLATVAGGSGLLLGLPFPGAQLIILGLIAATTAAISLSARLRSWVDAIPLRVLVGVNATRFVGITFLVLAARGELNATFAGLAGWGDIAVAIVAIVLVLTAAPRVMYHAWNLFGVLDLVVAVGTATVVTLQGVTPGIAPVLAFPLSLIPTVLVPLFISNHIVIFRRLRSHGG